MGWGGGGGATTSTMGSSAKAIVGLISAAAVVCVAVLSWNLEINPPVLESLAIKKELAPSPELGAPDVARRTADRDTGASAPEDAAANGTYEAVIITPEGKPATEAVVEFRVELFEPSFGFQFQSKIAMRRVLSREHADADGRVRVELPTGLSFDVAVHVPGEPECLREDRHVGAAVEEIRLQAAAGLHGRVLTHDGMMGIPGAKLHVSRPGHSESLGTAETAVDGTYRLAGMPAETLTITASVPDRMANTRQLELLPGRSREHDFKLAVGETLIGRVLDATNDLPIAGARIWMACALDGVTSDDDGRFELAGYRTSSYDWPCVAADGYGFREVRPLEEANHGGEMVVRLHPGVELSGRLIDEGGAAVANARVLVIDWKLPSVDIEPEQRYVAARRDVCEAQTDSDGKFVCSDLRADGEHRLLIVDERAALVEYRLPKFERADRVRDVGTLRVAPPHGLHGVVTDASGVAIPYQRVSLIPFADCTNQLVPSATPDVTSYFIDKQDCVADGSGRFAFRHVPAGRVDLTVIDSSSRPVVKVSRALTASTPVEAIEFRLQNSPSIGGTVRDEAGNPVRDAIVRFGMVADDPAKDRTIRASDDGRFLLRNLNPGRYRLSAMTRFPAHAALGRSPNVEVETGVLDVNVTLPFVHWVDCRVTIGDAVPVNGATIVFTPNDHNLPKLLTRTIETGIGVAGLSPGQAYDVVVTFESDDGRETVHEQVSYVAGLTDRRGELDVQLVRP